MPIFRQTLALAERLQRLSDRPLTQRQAIRRAVWLQEEARALQEQLADYQQQQTRQPD
ncbi:MAG: hypothetical protein ACFCVB_18980 [Nodosilinea sp.]